MKRKKGIFLLFFIFLQIASIYSKKDEANSEESSEEEETEEPTSSAEMETYKYLAKRLKQSAVASSRQRVDPRPYAIPGPFEPLPGRSHNGDYWPVFPFSNQYSGGLDLDPSISRHIGGDINIPIPSWGMMDITGRFFNRIHDTTTKFGYINHPVNMLGLSKEDFATLVSDPRLAANRQLHPTLPLGKVARTNVPINCKPPMCNPYTGTFALGIDHDWGGHDGNEGDINIPFPVSKGVAYRFPFGGNYYYDRDNMTITYGHNLSPIDPYANPYIFNNDYTRRRELLPPERDVYPRSRRSKRDVFGFAPIYSEDSSGSQKVTSKDFKSRLPMQNLKKMMKPQPSLFWGQQKVRQKVKDAIEPQFYVDYESPENVRKMGIRSEMVPDEILNLNQNYHQMMPQNLHIPKYSTVPFQEYIPMTHWEMPKSFPSNQELFASQHQFQKNPTFDQIPRFPQTPNFGNYQINVPQFVDFQTFDQIQPRDFEMLGINDIDKRRQFHNFPTFDQISQFLPLSNLGNSQMNVPQYFDQFEPQDISGINYVQQQPSFQDYPIFNPCYQVLPLQNFENYEMNVPQYAALPTFDQVIQHQPDLYGINNIQEQLHFQNYPNVNSFSEFSPIPNNKMPQKFDEVQPQNLDVIGMKNVQKS